MYTWEDIEGYVGRCERCPLSATRKKAVMGRGNHHADIMFIAEAPGAREDEEGIPFVGPAGQLFDTLLQDCNLSRNEIYITNLLKCHPPGNRDPKEDEKEQCFPYLQWETYLLKPKIIVCLGRVAAQRIISPDYRITRQHGTWITRNNCALTAVYHPSALLRDPSKMDAAKRDFQAIAARRDHLTEDK